MIADSHGFIRVRGARENNLRGVDLDIPKRRLTVFTGISGSGKSSLVFATIASEAQRLVNETYPAFVQGLLPSQERPNVDLLEGLTTTIVVDQERMGSTLARPSAPPQTSMQCSEFSSPVWDGREWEARKPSPSTFLPSPERGRWR